MNGLKNVALIYNNIFTHENLNLAICDNMDGNWGYHA